MRTWSVLFLAIALTVLPGCLGQPARHRESSGPNAEPFTNLGTITTGKPPGDRRLTSRLSLAGSDAPSARSTPRPPTALPLPPTPPPTAAPVPPIPPPAAPALSEPPEAPKAPVTSPVPAAAPATPTSTPAPPATPVSPTAAPAPPTPPPSPVTPPTVAAPPPPTKAPTSVTAILTWRDDAGGTEPHRALYLLNGKPIGRGELGVAALVEQVGRLPAGSTLRMGSPGPAPLDMARLRTAAQKAGVTLEGP